MNPNKKHFFGNEYNTATSKEIGAFVPPANILSKRESLYQTPEGRLFLARQLTDEAKKVPEIVRRGAIYPCGMEEAKAWANVFCKPALRYLKAMDYPDFQEALPLAEYRETVLGTTVSVHFVIYKAVDAPVYYVATNSMPPCPFLKKRAVAVCGVEGIEDFCETLYVVDMEEAEIKWFVENNMTSDVYIKCFGEASKA